MSSLGFPCSRVDRPQRPSPALEVHQELRRAHLPHALVTRTPPTRQRAGTRRLGSGDAVLIPPRSLLIGPARRRISQVWDPRAHVVAAKKAGHDVGRDQVARLMAVSGMWGRRASPRGDDERDAVVSTSPPTLFTGSFGRNVRTRGESRTGPPSAPPKGWPTSLSSTPRAA